LSYENLLFAKKLEALLYLMDRAAESVEIGKELPWKSYMLAVN